MAIYLPSSCFDCAKLSSFLWGSNWISALSALLVFVAFVLTPPLLMGAPARWIYRWIHCKSIWLHQEKKYSSDGLFALMSFYPWMVMVLGPPFLSFLVGYECSLDCEKFCKSILKGRKVFQIGFWVLVGAMCCCGWARLSIWSQNGDWMVTV